MKAFTYQVYKYDESLNLTIDELIRDAIEYLDLAASQKIIPEDWSELIDLDTLDLAFPEVCILGQLWHKHFDLYCKGGDSDPYTESAFQLARGVEIPPSASYLQYIRDSLANASSAFIHPSPTVCYTGFIISTDKLTVSELDGLYQELTKEWKCALRERNQLL